MLGLRPAYVLGLVRKVRCGFTGTIARYKGPYAARKMMGLDAEAHFTSFQPTQPSYVFLSSSGDRPFARLISPSVQQAERISGEVETEMASGGGYGWALVAGFNAALAAISAKFFAPPLLKYGMVILFNVTMWGCYVNSLKALSSLQATVTNFAANFISSGLAGYFLFDEPLPSKWFAGASLIIIGVFILSKSNIEEKQNSD